MRKGDDGEMGNKWGVGGGGRKKKIKTFLVVTNIVASRPPEHRPTGTPTACAKMQGKYLLESEFFSGLVLFFFVFRNSFTLVGLQNDTNLALFSGHISNAPFLLKPQIRAVTG